MNDSIGKIPYLRFLLPVLAGIVAAALLPRMHSLGFALFFCGTGIMAAAFFMEKRDPFAHRWIFGAGVFLAFFSLAVVQYAEQEKSTRFTLPETETVYIGVVQDIPQIKPRSVACVVKLRFPQEKKTMLYLEQTDKARMLMPGNEIVFRARMQPFRNFGNPDDFDYERFMKVKGFSASGYVSAANWHKTPRNVLTIGTASQKIRGKILQFYRSFGLSDDGYAFLSALTLGYKADLPDAMKAAFRASGTAHVLAVSGLHVAIIYTIINFLFSFLGKHGRRYAVRQLLVILALWGYVFLTGMPMSVIRAAIMLSIFCMGNMLRQKGFTYNSLAAAAFFILVFSPFSLFDVGFQMSFAAVFAILFFQPKISSLYIPPNKVAKYVWALFTVSLAAQIGVFPLVLYYFGTFPTYFFVTNLLVVPLIGVVIYAALPLAVTSLFLFLNAPAVDFLHAVFRWILSRLTELTLGIVHVAETLPLAELTDGYISFPQLVFALVFVYVFTLFLTHGRARFLLVSAAAALLFLVSQTAEKLTREGAQLVVFNTSATSEIGFFLNDKRHAAEIPQNGFVPHPEKRILRLSDGTFNKTESAGSFPVDVLILSEYRYFNMEKIAALFRPEVVVIDSSVPRFAAGKLAEECRRLNISVHDVAQNGAFSVKI